MSNQHSLTDEQIEMLRLLIQDEIEVAGVGIEGMEEGVWDLMDSQLDKRWKEFKESFREAMRPQQKEHDAAPWLEITYDAFKLTSDPE